jgi:hypothetical protein
MRPAAQKQKQKARKARLSFLAGQKRLFNQLAQISDPHFLAGSWIGNDLQASVSFRP